MKKQDKSQEVISKLCKIQKEFNDAVVFRIGIKGNGQIDIISADNTFSNKKQPKQEEIEVELPETPDYIG